MVSPAATRLSQLPPFHKGDARWSLEHFGSQHRRSEGTGTLEVKDGQLTLGDLVLPIVSVTSGCFAHKSEAGVVILLRQTVADRIEIPVAGRSEGTALLAALGLARPGRPMPFRLVPSPAPSQRRGQAMQLVGWAAMVVVVIGAAWILRSVGYRMPGWMYVVLALPVAWVWFVLTMREYTMLLVLASDGFVFGGRKKRRKVPLSSVRGVETADDGVLVHLTSGETLHLKTQAAAKDPDPTKDVLYRVLAARVAPAAD